MKFKRKIEQLLNQKQQSYFVYSRIKNSGNRKSKNKNDERANNNNGSYNNNDK